MMKNITLAGAASLILFLLCGNTLPLPFEYLMVGKNHISYEKSQTKFADVHQLLGSSKIHSKGQGGEHVVYTCYSFSSKNQQTTLKLGSGPLGAEKWLTYFDLSNRQSNRISQSKCTASDIPPDSIRTDQGIYLGMSKTKISARLGKPTKQTDSTLVYRADPRRRGFEGDRHHSKNQSKKIQGYNAYSWLKIWFRQDKAVRMEGARYNVE